MFMCACVSESTWLKLLLLLHSFNGLFSRTAWVNHSGFHRSKRWWLAVASAGPYANHLHLASDRQPCQYLTTQFLQAGRPSCHPTNSIKVLKKNLHGSKTGMKARLWTVNSEQKLTLILPQNTSPFTTQVQL